MKAVKAVEAVDAVKTVDAADAVEAVKERIRSGSSNRSAIQMDKKLVKFDDVASNECVSESDRDGYSSLEFCNDQVSSDQGIETDIDITLSGMIKIKHLTTFQLFELLLLLHMLVLTCAGFPNGHSSMSKITPRNFFTKFTLFNSRYDFMEGKFIVPLLHTIVNYY